MPKAKIRGSKEHNAGRKPREIERRIRERNHAFGNEIIRVRINDFTVLVVVLLYISVGMSAKSECTLRGQSVLNLQSAKENIVSVFHSVIAAKLDRPQMKANVRTTVALL